MRGLSFGGSSTIEFLDVPDPVPGEGDVVLEMKASGMCGSDLKMYRAPRGTLTIARVVMTKPVIAGHEPCGVVAAVGPGVTPQQARVGDRVMVHHYAGCTVCDHCRSGWEQMCDRQTPLVFGIGADGGHAPYMKVPARTLVPLPDALSFEAGAAISCGTGTAFQGLKRAGLSGDDTIAIFGQGPVGLAGTQLAAVMGARVIALDIQPERLTRARALGAHETVNPKTEDAVARIRELTNGKGVRVAMEASASPEARSAALASLSPWGTLVLIAGSTSFTVENVSTITSRQLTIIGSWTFSKVGQAKFARYVADRGIPVDQVFTDRWRLEQGEEAYRHFAQQSAGKGVFLM
ncbi:zinc-dependent alcohol dehydrogenase family protein [Faunimonas sp. B44]|uniref:zinc-dependent alcohol dehydrogenase family protein n=1 Tax=Faunimonas sp. B44 TaxID=3461493 RepID=UPI004044F6D9